MQCWCSQHHPQPLPLTHRRGALVRCSAISTPTSAISYESYLDKDLPSLPPDDHLDPADFPDGGTTAWLVVLGSWCGFFCSFGWINSIGVFQEHYQYNQLSSYTPSTIAWIPSFEVFIMFFAGPVAGKLFDNYGPRYVLLSGSILQVFGLMMTSLATTYWQIFLAQGLVAGLGGSFVFFASIAPIPTWFYRRRCLALGIASTGSSIGGVIFPIMLRKIIPSIGFGWAIRISAFTILVLLVVANLTVKSRLKPDPRPVKLAELWRPMKEPPFSTMVLGSLFFNFGTYIPYNFIMVHARKYGMNLDLVTYLLPIMSGASVFGRILPGVFADRIGKFNTIITTCATSMVLVLVLWVQAKSTAAIIAFSALYGFASGSFVSLGPALVAQLCDVREIGVRSGIMFLLVSFAGLTGNPIAGALLGDTLNFDNLIIFCGSVMGIGALFFVASRWAQVGWKLAVI